MKNKAHSRMTKPLLLTGLLLIVTGIFMLAGNAGVMAQEQPDEADYIGVRECRSCHRDLGDGYRKSPHAQALQEVDGDKSIILGDFARGQDVRQMQFPGEPETRPLSVNDIRYVVGSGENIQRYLYELDDGTLMVLPVEWNTLEQVWQPYVLGDAWPGEAYDWNFNCAGCHTTGLDVETGHWEDDGVQCESCHGPGSAHADAVDDAGREPTDEELERIHNTIVTSIDAEICGQCHSQGQMPDDHRPFPADYQPGDSLVDGGYSLVDPSDPTFWHSSGHARLSNMQFNEWVMSGHASALTTMLESDYADDSCLVCHSGDTAEGVTLETAQFGVTCATCHDPHGSTGLDSMLVEESEALCESCHQDAGRTDEVHHPALEMFTGVQIVDIVAGVPSNHLTAGATCVTCHMPPEVQTGDTWYNASHLLNPAFPGEVEEFQPDSCTTCHTDLSGNYLQQFIDKIQNRVSNRLASARVASTSRENVPGWVTDTLNFIDGDGSMGVHNYQYTSQLLDAVEVELGLAVVTVPDIIPAHEIADPQDCAECHANEHREWQMSPHANASLSQTFQAQYADSGQPSYCMGCHASGYDPRTQQYVFEGVTCSNCHYTTEGVEHPPGPVEIATDSQVCGRCHSGEHSPTYNEWLVSDHAAVGIDCVDCHTPHNNGLLLETVNDTCGDCHEEALVDEIHMGDDMNCSDCHMARITNQNGVQVVATGHSMNIDPSVCADCHGNTHLLSSDGTSLIGNEAEHVAQMQAELEQAQEIAAQNLNSGIVGGALGALILVLIVFVAIRLGRVR